MITLSNTARVLMASLVGALVLLTAYQAGTVQQVYASYILPQPLFQTTVLPHIAPSCDVQAMASELGIPMENIASANSSGTSNGVQIHLNLAQKVKVPANAGFEVLHNYGKLYFPGSQTPETDAFTAYKTAPC